MQLKGASLGWLLLHLVKLAGAAEMSQNREVQTLFQIFVTTVSSYAEPKIVIDILDSIYNMPEKDARKIFGSLKAARLGVAHCLRRWLAAGMDFLRPHHLRALLPVACELVSQFDPDQLETLRLSQLLEGVSNRLTNGIAAVMDPCAEPVADTAPPPILNPRVDILSIDLSLLDIDPKEIARQITLIDSCMFRQIPNYEWLQKSWGTPRFEHKAEATRKFIDRFNACNLWVSTELLKVRFSRGVID